MAQGYKLVEKKNLGRDAAEQPTKVYAIPKYNGWLGKFGNFRLSLSSEGANDMEGFDRSMIVGARVIFTPGASLKKTLKTTNFASFADETTATGTDDEENGGTPGGV